MSKQVTSMARLTGQLERMFKAINHDFFNDFFNDELEIPTISVIPTNRHMPMYLLSLPGNAAKT